MRLFKNGFIRSAIFIFTLIVLNVKYVEAQKVMDSVLMEQSKMNAINQFKQVLNENALVMEYKGAQPTKYFYGPTYPNIQSKNSSMPDFRNVLLWQPNIHIENNFKKQIDFYSADLPGKYAIVVQGLSSEGLLGSSIKYITVK